MTKALACSRGCTNPIDGSGWPDGNGGVLCQDHWEEDCDRDWWAVLTGDGPILVFVDDEAAP